MKKITLLVTALVVFGSAAKASEKELDSFGRPINVSEAQPISFVERGIQFLVFADGQFDFNTRPSTTGEIYYKNGARSVVNTTFGVPAMPIRNNGVLVEHDNLGRVRRIGNVFINYDASNRIKRIGSVYMTYNRFALSQIGGLSIIYNRRGQITGYSGSVNQSQHLAYNANIYGGQFVGSYGSANGSAVNNDAYYYYRSDGTKALIEPKK